MPCNDCEEELITTSQGPKGDTGATGATGSAGSNGFLNWSEYDTTCLEAQGVFESEDTNPEKDQKFIDSYCEIVTKLNTCPTALDDYIVINQDTNGHIIPQSNDNYLLPTTVLSISQDPVNGTATINDDSKTITYIPNEGFVGNDVFEYTLTDGDCTSTASIFITINAVISQQTIQDTVLEQLTILLQSNDYWDLGFNIGDKIGISNINLVDFDFTNAFTAGKGKNTARYKKWAICNGNNGTEDLTEGTFRGFDHTNTDYDESAKTGGSDTLSFTLTKGNIPAHVHTYSSPNKSDGEWYASIGGAPSHGIAENPSSSTTGDGSADGLKTNPDAINEDVRNTFKTVILIQKIIA